MLLKCTKRINHRKRVISSAIALIIIASSIAGAVLTAPVAVFALSAGGIQSTIASIILSLLLQCGAAPVNQSYIDALNTSYGYTIETAISEGLLTETAEGLIDSGLSSAIESASAYTELGLDDIFTTTIDDVGVAAASGGINIANTAINVGKAGTIGAFAGAVAVGVGAGVLINHLRERIGNYIKYGMPMNVQEFIAETDWEGFPYYLERFSNNRIYTYVADSPSGCYAVLYRNGQNGYNGILKNYNNSTVEIKNYSYTNEANTSEYTTNVNSNQTVNISSIADSTYNILRSHNYSRIFDTYQEAYQYLDSLSENTIPSVISPDIIGQQGNQTYDNGNYPGLVNQIPEGSDMQPVSMDDYQDYMDLANNNTQNGNTDQETQGTAFDNFIDPYIVAAPTIPDQPIIPENPDDVPEVPDRPIVPEQPTIPDKPNIDQETLDQALQGATTIDLRAIFPFCIPFDLYNLLLIFDTGENRKAPHITFTFPITGWVIDVDLAPFDPVAGILRLLELILFIVGLAVATRSLIGAGGSG